eukprot:2797075-Rhodomonas_salina.3
MWERLVDRVVSAGGGVSRDAPQPNAEGKDRELDPNDTPVVCSQPSRDLQQRADLCVGGTANGKSRPPTVRANPLTANAHHAPSTTCMDLECISTNLQYCNTSVRPYLIDAITSRAVRSRSNGIDLLPVLISGQSRSFAFDFGAGETATGKFY